MTDKNRVVLRLGDCIEQMREIPDNSVDAIVTDPPYGLSFMGKHWDHGVPSGEVWQQCLRVLKPGGHLLAFAGTRTQHRMACNIEDAGFEIRDMIAWVYGSGFPKSLDVSKAIDKAAGAEREVVGSKLGMPGYSMTDGKGGLYGDGFGANGTGEGECRVTAPATEAAQQWQGWGTALKPALEPVTVARKPFKGTVAANVLEHGTGALNVDGCRVELNGDYKCKPNGRPSQTGLGDKYDPLKANQPDTQGRWPANLIHDGSEEVVGLLNGSARFFYCAKASKKDRGADNKHPTVKPTDLMRYLIRLVTPPGGTVLDPFMGSGSTGKACVLEEGFGFIGIEREPEYMEIAQARINEAQGQHEFANDNSFPCEKHINSKVDNDENNSLEEFMS